MQPTTTSIASVFTIAQVSHENSTSRLAHPRLATFVARMSNMPERLSMQTDNCNKSSAIIINIDIHHLVQRDASAINESSDLTSANNLNAFPDPNSTVDVTPEPQPATPFNCNKSCRTQMKSSTITQPTTTSIASVFTIAQDLSCENMN